MIFLLEVLGVYMLLRVFEVAQLNEVNFYWDTTPAFHIVGLVSKVLEVSVVGQLVTSHQVEREMLRLTIGNDAYALLHLVFIFKSQLRLSE